MFVDMFLRSVMFLTLGEKHTPSNPFNDLYFVGFPLLNIFWHSGIKRKSRDFLITHFDDNDKLGLPFTRTHCCVI